MSGAHKRQVERGNFKKSQKPSESFKTNVVFAIIFSRAANVKNRLKVSKTILTPMILTLFNNFARHQFSGTFCGAPSHSAEPKVRLQGYGCSPLYSSRCSLAPPHLRLLSSSKHPLFWTLANLMENEGKPLQFTTELRIWMLRIWCSVAIHHAFF